MSKSWFGVLFCPLFSLLAVQGSDSKEVLNCFEGVKRKQFENVSYHSNSINSMATSLSSDGVLYGN